MNDLRFPLKEKWFKMTNPDGKPEWGAEPGKFYFVIKHGEEVK